MVSQLKNINVDVQDESDRLLYPLSLSPFLFKYIITRTLSLQFQVNARLDRTNWTWFHGIYILSLSLTRSNTNHTGMNWRTKFIHARFIFDLLVYSRYTYTRVEQSVLSHRWTKLRMHGFKGGTRFDIPPISSIVLRFVNPPALLIEMIFEGGADSGAALWA